MFSFSLLQIALAARDIQEAIAGVAAPAPVIFTAEAADHVVARVTGHVADTVGYAIRTSNDINSEWHHSSGTKFQVERFIVAVGKWTDTCDT